MATWPMHSAAAQAARAAKRRKTVAPCGAVSRQAARRRRYGVAPHDATERRIACCRRGGENKKLVEGGGNEAEGIGSGFVSRAGGVGAGADFPPVKRSDGGPRVLRGS